MEGHSGAHCSIVLMMDVHVVFDFRAIVQENYIHLKHYELLNFAF